MSLLAQLCERQPEGLQALGSLELGRGGVSVSLGWGVSLPVPGLWLTEDLQ